MSVEDIRRKAGSFQSKIFWRNAREYVTALAVVIFFGFQLFLTRDALMRAGYGVMIAGMMYLAWQLHRKGSSRSLPEEMGLASGLEFFRRELERQRDLVQSVWSWYLGPLIPGWVLLTAAMARANPGHLRQVGLALGILNLVAALAFVFVWKLNQRAAGSLQRLIDELDTLRER
ncbi:MAG: hypothetical protein ACLQGV_05005 [Bryobacteraceae bacterium]